MHAYAPSRLCLWQHVVLCAIASLGDVVMMYGIVFIAYVALRIASKRVNFYVNMARKFGSSTSRRCYTILHP